MSNRVLRRTQACAIVPAIAFALMGFGVAAPTASAQADSCDPAYPTVCIPSGPDLDCGEISERGFRVESPDPHRFDADNDGVGCES